MEYIDRVWFKTPPNTSSETTLHLYFTKIESESLFYYQIEKIQSNLIS